MKKCGIMTTVLEHNQEPIVVVMVVIVIIGVVVELTVKDFTYLQTHSFLTIIK